WNAYSSRPPTSGQNTMTGRPHRETKEATMIRRITLFALPLAISGTLAHAELGPKKPSDLVNVVAFRGFSDTCCSSSETAFDLTFDAEGERTSFAIPAGKVFVVTGIEWNSFNGTPDRRTSAAVELRNTRGCAGLFRHPPALAAA